MDVSSLLETDLQHLHLWGLFSSKSQCDERQRHEKKHQQTRRGAMDIHISKLCRHLASYYNFAVEAIRSTRNAMSVNCPEDGRLVLWKIWRILTCCILSPSLSIFTHPRLLQNLLPYHLVLLLGGYDSPFHTLEALNCESLNRHWWPPVCVRILTLKKKTSTSSFSQRSLKQTTDNTHGFQILNMNASESNFLWILQWKFEEKTSRLNGMPDHQSSFDQMLVAVDSSCSCCYTLEFLLPGSMFGKKICLQSLCIEDNASHCCWVFGYSCSSGAVIIFATFLPFC